MVRRRSNIFSHVRDCSSEAEPATQPGTSWTSWTSHLTSSEPDSASTTPPSDMGAGPARDSHPRSGAIDSSAIGMDGDMGGDMDGEDGGMDGDMGGDMDGQDSGMDGGGDSSHLQEMGGCIEAQGKRRALQLLFTVPERFIAFCHFNQTTFFELADWILANVPSQVGADISVEESLFVFLDVVARGNSFGDVAYRWDHDLELTQSIFLNILNALNALRTLKDVSPTCPAFQKTRKRWEVARRWTPNRQMQTNGKVKIGYNDQSRDGLEVSQAQMRQALEALNNFIHEYTEYDGA